MILKTGLQHISRFVLGLSYGQLQVCREFATYDIA